MPDETSGYEELSADIRLLGRLLGDVIRAHAGSDTFDLVESVRRIAGVVDPLEILREVGGAELVGMAAAAIAARHRSIPVVLDGYICTASMLPLHAARPDALDHCIVGHCSAEPGHRLLLERLDKRPLLDLDMRLGEGSGAMAAVPLVRMACAGVVEVATFDEWFGTPD